MLDLKFVVNNPDIVIADLKKRGQEEKITIVKELQGLYSQWLKLKQEQDRLRNRRNIISEEINKLQKQKKDISEKVKEIKELPHKIKEVEFQQEEINLKIKNHLFNIPNILHKSVPIGKDDTENKVIKKWGTLPKFKFTPQHHQDILENLDKADFKRSTKVSGARFYYLKNEIVLLELALIHFALEHLMKKGFTPILTPNLVKEEILEGAGYLPKGKEDIYYIKDQDLCLVGTSEQAIAGLHKDEIIPEEQLPLKYAGFSPCYRTEAGSHGKDTKGIFRTHQFNKVEQFIFAHPDQSWKLFDELMNNSETLFQKLKIPYRVVSVCTGDIGMVASKKYDIEAWMPGQQEGKGAYREVTSCSNCTAYQSTRLNVKYINKDGEKAYLHTLNNTAIATSRAMVAVIENYQQKDGSIKIPTVLQKYMNGIKKITKK